MSHRDTESERQLWAAVIKQALDDAFDAPETEASWLDRTDAVNWLSGGGVFKRDREIILALAGIDAEAFDRFISRRMNETAASRAAYDVKMRTQFASEQSAREEKATAKRAKSRVAAEERRIRNQIAHLPELEHRLAVAIASPRAKRGISSDSPAVLRNRIINIRKKIARQQELDDLRRLVVSPSALIAAE